MKVLFLLLALANIGFFTWEYQKDLANLSDASEPPAAVREDIVLLQELPNPPPLAPTGAALTALLAVSLPIVSQAFTLPNFPPIFAVPTSAAADQSLSCTQQ